MKTINTLCHCSCLTFFRTSFPSENNNSIIGELHSVSRDHSFTISIITIHIRHRLSQIFITSFREIADSQLQLLSFTFVIASNSMVIERAHRSLCVVLFGLLSVVNTYGFYVDITYLDSAVEQGAVCLDGSAPAYHWDKGSGSGINNWLVHIEGGGWCNNVTTCLDRSGTRLGSSNQMVEQVAFSGILHNQAQYNPDFYNWNKIKVRYCDGSSFTGDVEKVNPNTNLHFRGARIFRAVIEDLLAKGMNNSENAILSGCSAGGLTSILHCDNFKALLPESTTVKCLADAGYFINSRDILGTKRIEAFYDDVVKTHGSAKHLPRSCTSKMKHTLCFFPENVVQEIETPIFLINAAYDSWQIKNILAPGVADPHGTWHNCKIDIKKCSPEQIEIMQVFRLDFLSALDGFFGTSFPRGMFINSCYAHCQTEIQETWFMSDSPMLSNKTIGEAVGDWFYNRSSFEEIDCAYPCDKTCHNRIFG